LKSIYLTGSDGFIASNLIQLFKKKNLNLILLNRKSRLDFLLEKEHQNILVWAGEPSNISLVNKSDYSEQNNLSKIYRIFLEKNFDQVIYLSSVQIYKKKTTGYFYEEGDEISTNTNYSRGKAEREEITLSSRKGCVLRLSNVYGKGMKNNLFSDIRDEILLKGKKISIRNFNSIADFIFIDDVVESIYKLIDLDMNGLYNLSTGVGTSPLEVLKFISKEIELSKKIVETSPKNTSKLIAKNYKIKKSLALKSQKTIEEGIRELIKQGYFS